MTEKTDPTGDQQALHRPEQALPPAAAMRPNVIPWPPLLLLSLAAGAIAAGRLIPVGWPGMNDLPARLIGIGIGAAGLALAAWAVVTLHRAKTTVMPHQAASHLVTTGPFARFRNPIYMADVMLLLGIAELSKNIWFAVAAALFVPLVTWLAILPEERHLAARFGADWESYRERSRRWL